MFLPLFAVQAQQLTVVVGVLSPETHNSSVTGASHRYWTEQGLVAAGKIPSPLGNVTIKPVFIDTQSNDAECYNKVVNFLQNHPEAALLIGPVRSGCANTLITNDISLPIISSLASASVLTQDAVRRSEWFFRANINDQRRLEYLVNFIGRDADYNQNRSFLIYDAESAYGKGLADDLHKLVAIADVAQYTIVDSLENPAAILDRILDVEDPNSSTNVYILGNSSAVVTIANALQEVGEEHINKVFHIFTVGMNPTYLKSSVDGLITIGEVGFKENHSNTFEAERQSILKKVQRSGHKFYPTTYTAARFIVPEATKNALASLGENYDINDIDALRTALRNELVSYKSFSSISPPDVLSFDHNGDLVGKFKFPVFELEPSFKQINLMEAEPLPWIEVLSLSESVSFLESPVTISLVGHNTDDIPIHVTLTDPKSGHDYEFSINKLANKEQVTATFHVKWLGEYQISSNREIYPTATPIKVEFSAFYLVCCVFAVIGVFSKHRTSQAQGALQLADMLQGVIIGAALAFISTYVKYSIVPVVETDWNLLNGAMYGFIGGFFGPWILHVIAARFGVGSNPPVK
ncbi:hypothetical protein QX776_05125 [Alteromonadaceae bacterium BrNp21-10]|nr:hypothetical protein [Alteromonadaceae bacterium BrNp21-10]